MALDSDRGVPGSLNRWGRALFQHGRGALSLFWNVFWKVTAATTVLLFLLFLALHHDDFSRRFTEAAFAVVVVCGYCFCCAVWVGLAAGVFAVAWRQFGAWIVVPIVGAVLGTVAAVALTLAILRGIDLQGSGLHGGGDIAAFLMLTILAAAAVLGALVGGSVSGVIALLIAWTRRRGQ